MSLEYTIGLVALDTADAVWQVAADAVARAGGAADAVVAAPLRYEPTRWMYAESFGFEVLPAPLTEGSVPEPA